MVKTAPKPSAIPAPGEGKRGVAGHLPYLLHQANAAVRRALDRALADIGVTPPQFSILQMIAAYAPLSNADLARLALHTPQTINLIVANLVARGAVVRRPHAVHGRILDLDIAAGGRRLLAKCRVRVHAVEAALEKKLPGGAERTALRRGLIAIAVAFEEGAGKAKADGATATPRKPPTRPRG